jgi:hypothetical protein
MDNISDVTGNGTVGPSTGTDIHWPNIPAPGGSNGLEKGTQYDEHGYIIFSAFGGGFIICENSCRSVSEKSN